MNEPDAPEPAAPETAAPETAAPETAAPETAAPETAAPETEDAAPEITLYGSHWCPDCHRSRQFLGEQQIPYAWIDIEEDAEGEAFVIEANDGKRRIPTLVFGDGTVLSNPSNAELAAQLGLKTVASKSHYDLIIVGGGPAGLTAALYTAREGIDTLLIERGAFGGQTAATVHLDNVPGFPEGITGAELAGRLRRQAERFDVELLEAQEVAGLHSHHNYHCVELADGTEYSALAVLFATGSRYRRLGVEGEDDYFGSGVHYCATCDGPFYKGEPVAVVGGGNSAAEEGLFLSGMASHVTMLVRGDALRASQVIVDAVEERPNIDIRFHTEVESFDGADSKLARIKIQRNDGPEGGSEDDETLEVPAAFVFIGLDPNTSFLRETDVHLDDDGFVVTGHCLLHEDDLAETLAERFGTRHPAALETSVPGIFAAGDLRSESTKQVASAAGEGAAVALEIREFLRHQLRGQTVEVDDRTAA